MLSVHVQTFMVVWFLYSMAENCFVQIGKRFMKQTVESCNLLMRFGFSVQKIYVGQPISAGKYVPSHII